MQYNALCHIIVRIPIRSVISNQETIKPKLFNAYKIQIYNHLHSFLQLSQSSLSKFAGSFCVQIPRNICPALKHFQKNSFFIESRITLFLS